MPEELRSAFSRCWFWSRRCCLPTYACSR